MLSFSRANFQLCLRDHRSRSSLALAPFGALISEIQPRVPKYVRVAIFGASKVHEKSMRSKTLVFTMQNDLIYFPDVGPVMLLAPSLAAGPILPLAGRS